jgi:CoA-transferase family III
MPSQADSSLTESLWQALGGDRAALSSLSVSRADAWLGGQLAVDELAVGAVAAALMAAAELAQSRGAERPAIELCAAELVLPTPVDAARPCDGIRVLDLTRVIAGPVGARTLAALGADVLRVDPPHLPELPEGHVDTATGRGRWRGSAWTPPTSPSDTHISCRCRSARGAPRGPGAAGAASIRWYRSPRASPPSALPPMGRPACFRHRHWTTPPVTW